MRIFEKSLELKSWQTNWTSLRVSLGTIWSWLNFYCYRFTKNIPFLIRRRFKHVQLKHRVKTEWVIFDILKRWKQFIQQLPCKSARRQGRFQIEVVNQFDTNLTCRTLIKVISRNWAEHVEMKKFGGVFRVEIETNYIANNVNGFCADQIEGLLAEILNCFFIL